MANEIEELEKSAHEEAIRKNSDPNHFQFRKGFINHLSKRLVENLVAPELEKRVLASTLSRAITITYAGAKNEQFDQKNILKKAALRKKLGLRITGKLGKQKTEKYFSEISSGLVKISDFLHSRYQVEEKGNMSDATHSKLLSLTGLSLAMQALIGGRGKKSSNV